MTEKVAGVQTSPGRKQEKRSPIMKLSKELPVRSRLCFPVSLILISPDAACLVMDPVTETWLACRHPQAENRKSAAPL